MPEEGLEKFFESAFGEYYGNALTGFEMAIAYCARHPVAFLNFIEKTYQGDLSQTNPLIDGIDSAIRATLTNQQVTV